MSRWCSNQLSYAPEELRSIARNFRSSRNGARTVSFSARAAYAVDLGDAAQHLRKSSGVGDLDGEAHPRGVRLRCLAGLLAAILDRLRVDCSNVHLLLCKHLQHIAQQALPVRGLDDHV